MHKRNLSLLLQLILVLICSLQLILAAKNCSESIMMDSYFDTQNVVSDIRCSVTEFGLSNNLNLTATFPYTPKGKIILGSGLKLKATYYYPQSQYQQETSLWINDIFIMNLPLASLYPCSTSSYSLYSNFLELTSYLDLNASNTLKISTVMPSPTSSIYLTKVSLSFCYIPYDTTIVDLVVSSSVSSINFLTPLSYTQVKTEPFTGLFVNNLTDYASLPIVINNKAVDPAVNITVTIFPYDLYSISIISLQNIRKISTSDILIPSPDIQTNSNYSSISFTFYNVNLSHLETLAFDVKFQLSGTNSETGISSSLINIYVDSSNDFVEELNTADNSKSFSFSIFQTKSILSNVESASNPLLSAVAQVSDLGYFIHQPQSPFTQNCWFQVNLITSSTFSGSLYILSNRTMEQKKISFTESDFIGTTLFLAIPPEQLDCSGSNTAIYVRVEAYWTASFKFYLSRKFYSTLNDFSSTLNSVFSSKIQSGETFGVTISPLTQLEPLPIIANLTYFNGGSSVDKFLAFNTINSTSIELFSYEKGTSVPKNQYPNVQLSSKNVLYYFETNCRVCTVNLGLTYPSIYSNPPTASLLTTGYQFQEKALAPNGVHWFFLDTSKANSDTVTIFVLATVYGLSSSYQPSKLSFIATQDAIDNVINSNGALTRSVQSTVLYNQTLNCNNYSMRYPYQPSISILTPSVGSKGNLWKYGLSIDPSIKYSRIEFSYLALNYTNSVYYTTTTNYLSTLSDDFYYTLNVDYSYTNASDLSINFDNNLKIFDRSYVIYSKIGQLPTTTDYDMKTSEISFYNAGKTIRTYSLRYLFSEKGTFTVQGLTSRLISSSKLNQLGQKIYLYFREVTGSVFLNSYSCYLDSSYIFFQHSYTPSVTANSESAVILSYPNLILNASNLNISQSNIDGYINVEFTTTYSASSEETVFIIDWNTNELVTMNKTDLLYTSYYNDDEDTPTKYLAYSAKLNARIKISQATIDNKGLLITLIFPSTTYYKYTTNYAYVFVEQQVPVQPQTSPIFVTLGVVVGLFILCTIYLFICLYVIWGEAHSKLSLAKDYDASLTAFEERPSFIIFFDLPLLIVVFVSGLFNNKIHPIICKIILGLLCLFCSVAFYIGLLVPMGIYMNSLVNSESEIIPKRAQLASSSYYACCKYRPPSSIPAYASVMGTQDGTLRCMKPSPSFIASNLTINGEFYQPSIPSSSNFTYGTSHALTFAKVQCPNSEIIFVSTVFDSIPAFGISGLVLGTTFLFLAFFFLTVSLTDYLITKSVMKSKSKNHHTNITTNSNASIAHSDDTQHSNQIAIEQSESMRREQEEMARIDREEQLRNEREANIPPDIKQPPPKPSQPITPLELNEINITSVPQTDNQPSNLFVYNTNGNFINPTPAIYNPYENTEDIVVVYQRNPSTQ